MTKILLAGGGTAGHIEPALAIAKAWRTAHPGDEICFLGTAAGLEMTLIPAAGFPVFEIPKVAIARSFSPTLLKVPFQLFAAVARSLKLLKGVDCAIGFGGYVSGPLYVAAALKRVPLVIHEQNAKPGWANRLGAYFTSHLAISYPVTRGRLAKASLTGLPLRSDVVSALNGIEGNWLSARESAKTKVASRYQLNRQQPIIFIFGGSQGSRAINRIVAEVRDRLKDLNLTVIHGVGKNNELPSSDSSYRALSYIDDMADCYLAADLLIARSGAVTCAEATALARYSLFIPLPIGNGEQSLNAQALIKSGRAEIVKQDEFTADWLIEQLPQLIQRSAAQSVDGDTSGLYAADKIVKIIEKAAGVQ